MPRCCCLPVLPQALGALSYPRMPGANCSNDSKFGLPKSLPQIQFRALNPKHHHITINNQIRPAPPVRILPLRPSPLLSNSVSLRLSTVARFTPPTMAMAPTNRGKPFTNWVKKLNQKMKRTKGLNNPYPQSGHVSSKHPQQRMHESQPQSIDYPHSSNPDADDDERSRLPEPSLVIHSAEELSNRQSLVSAPSARGSADVDREGCPRNTAGTALSYGGTSLAGTMITATDPRRPDSTFSSPAPSARSVATTLSTIQSQMANGVLAGAAANGAHVNNQNTAQASASRQNHQTDSVLYSQPQALVAAVDRNTRTAYRPATYSAIIANNLLSDNISILTLASSTQRRRRRSWDTDFDHASVRALPPSQFGGSRESLPLSVLSANLDGQPTSPGMNTTARSIAERSVSGVAMGHSRADSISGSIGGGPVPVASES